MTTSRESASTQNAIEIRGLGHRFAEHRLFADLSLDVPRGAVFGLLGRNGTGKTTLLQLLMGLLRRQEGAIDVLGHDPGGEPLEVRARVGYVPEQPSFYPWMRVGELTAFVARHRPSWDFAWAEELRQRFGLEEKRRVGELSKGETALLALLAATAFRPPLLVLDEPAQGLDPVARRRFFEGVLASYGDDGGTVVMSSHLIRDISTLVDHVALLGRGGLVCSSTTEDLRQRVRGFRIAPLDAPLQGLDKLDGLRVLAVEKMGRQARLVVELDVDPAGVSASARLAEQLDPSGTARLEEVPLDLEEIFFVLGGGGD